MTGYQTDPNELAEAARTLDDAAGEVAAAVEDLADAPSGLGPAGLDAAAEVVLLEQADLVRGIAEDLAAAGSGAREVSLQYLRLDDDVRDDFTQAGGEADV